VTAKKSWEPLLDQGSISQKKNLTSKKLSAQRRLAKKIAFQFRQQLIDSPDFRPKYIENSPNLFAKKVCHLVREKRPHTCWWNKPLGFQTCGPPVVFMLNPRSFQKPHDLIFCLAWVIKAIIYYLWLSWWRKTSYFRVRFLLFYSIKCGPRSLFFFNLHIAVFFCFNVSPRLISVWESQIETPQLDSGRKTFELLSKKRKELVLFREYESNYELSWVGVCGEKFRGLFDCAKKLLPLWPWVDFTKIYVLLLHSQITKVQKIQSSLFCSFGISMRKSCA